MRKRLLRKCVIGLILLAMLATLTLVGSTSITQAQPPQGTVQIIVKFKSSNNSTAFAAAVQGFDNITPVAPAIRGSDNIASIASAVQASGGRGLRDLPQLRTHVISVPAGAADNVLAAFENDPSVERAAKAVTFHQAGTPDDPGYTQQWALPKIAWDQVYGTTPITGSAIIAVLDTGVDAGHPDLAGRMGSGKSFVNGDANSDPNGHGTALAGIAAANVNNDVGIAGIAYDGVTVSSVQVLQPDGTGLDSDVIAGVVWAVDNGAKVILMGFSSADYSAALEDALQYAWSQGAVLVAATGNDSSSAPSYPAGMENVLGVASTDQDDNLAAYSNTGSACVAAPGSDIYTTIPGGNYGAISGTSAAAAETAGLAALLVASGQSNAYIYDQVRGAVDPITDQPFGRINVATAMGEAVTPPPGPEPEPPPPPGPTPPVYAPAAAYIASVSGDWSNPATWGGGSLVPVAGDTVTINSGITVTVTANAACASITFPTNNTASSNVNINSGITLAVSGAITIPRAANPNMNTVAVGAGILNAGSVAFTSGGGTNRHQITISTGTVTVSGDVTQTGSTGSATIAFSGAGTLNLGGALFTSTTGTLTLATGCTVNYNGSVAQTVQAFTYNNLTISGSGAKTTTGVTVNGILSMEGTATVSAAPTYGAAATLRYNTATGRTAGAEWRTPFAATGGVIIANTGTITMNVAKVFNASVPLTINSGATLATGNFQLTFGGNFVNNNGTFTAGSSPIVIANTMATQSIAGFTTTGTVSCTKTSGTATFTGNVSSGPLSKSGAGTLNLGTGFTHQINGAVTFTNGTLNGGSSILSLTGNFTGNGGTFTASTGTINFNGSAAQIINRNVAIVFNNLTINNAAGVSNNHPTGGTTVNGMLTLTNGTFTLTTGLTMGNGATITRDIGSLSAAPNFGTSVNVSYIGTSATTAGPEIPTIATILSNLTINKSGGVTLNATSTVNGTLTLTSGNITTGANTLIIASTGSVSGGSNSSYVNGYLQKNVATGAQSRTFEVGTLSGYSPVAITFGSVTAPGDLIAKATAGDHPSLGSSTIDPGKSVNIYWTLTNSGITFNNYDATFNFNPGDIDGGATPANFIVGKYNSGWTYPTHSTGTATSIQATGLTSLSDFAVGELAAPTVTSVSPNQGTQGATINNIVIAGTYFTGATSVSFDADITVNDFNTDNTTQITANITIAPSATPGARVVSVTTPGGTGTLPGGFTVLQAAPTVTSVSPNQGTQGATLNNVIVTGTYFTGATSVSFDADITVNDFNTDNTTQITANITIASDATPGVRDVSVTTPGGTGKLSGGFTVLQTTNISFTVTKYSDNITFSNLDPGMFDHPADQNSPIHGAVTLEVLPDTNVAVDIQLKGSDFTGPITTIPIGNVKYNSDNTTSGASIMPSSYLTWYNVPAYTDNKTECYHWISIPAGEAPGSYTSTFYFQAIKQP